MKVRQGFVTNSSSSSFVVAIKQQGCTKDDILDILMEEKDNLNLDCIDIESDGAARVLLKRVAKQLFDMADTPIGDVMVGCGGCSNEDGDEGFVLYNLGSINTPNFVFKSGN